MQPEYLLSPSWKLQIKDKGAWEGEEEGNRVKFERKSWKLEPQEGTVDGGRRIMWSTVVQQHEEEGGEEEEEEKRGEATVRAFISEVEQGDKKNQI